MHDVIPDDITTLLELDGPPTAPQPSPQPDGVLRSTFTQVLAMMTDAQRSPYAGLDADGPITFATNWRDGRATISAWITTTDSQAYRLIQLGAGTSTSVWSRSAVDRYLGPLAKTLDEMSLAISICEVSERLAAIKVNLPAQVQAQVAFIAEALHGLRAMAVLAYGDRLAAATQADLDAIAGLDHQLLNASRVAFSAGTPLSKEALAPVPGVTAAPLAVEAPASEAPAAVTPPIEDVSHGRAINPKGYL